MVNISKKFESIGSILNKKSTSHPRIARSNEIIASVSESVEEIPSTSIRYSNITFPEVRICHLQSSINPSIIIASLCKAFGVRKLGFGKSTS